MDAELDMMLYDEEGRDYNKKLKLNGKTKKGDL